MAPETFKRLRIALAARGWRAADLARALGFNRQTCARWVAGSRPLPAARVEAVAALLGVEPGWLSGGAA